MKRKTFFIIVILILFLNFFLNMIPNSYKKVYKTNKYKVTEEYNKKNKVYNFTIVNGSDSFKMTIKKKYITKKRLITKIKKIKINNGYCLVPTGKKLDFYPVCIQNGTYKSYHLIYELKGKISKSYYKEVKTIDKSYDALDVNYLNKKKYLIWNYRYFYYLDNKKVEKIHLFDSDYYQIDLATQINKYLFVPNYDEGFSFNKAYVINMDNGDLEDWDLNIDISLESRILGVYKKSIYLLDEKNEVLYEIVPHKMKIRKVEGKILEGNKFKKYSIKDIINNNLSFNYNGDYNYTIKNNMLYLENSNTLLSNNHVSKIIHKDNDTVYYLVGDNLYMFNPLYGNVLLINNFEWSFNNNNMIFIY